MAVYCSKHSVFFNPGGFLPGPVETLRGSVSYCFPTMSNQGENMKSSNRLEKSNSPYLLQHAENPVDWFPWGEEAFRKAKQENKPVFLSIGYSTCHWCHVMAHESFEDQEVADLLNREFVSIKVDREERPDIDQVYMNVCQVLTGRGGWPLSIFMTPEKKPFFAGTYFPTERRMGMPGFKDVCNTVVEAWAGQRPLLEDSSEQITASIQEPPEENRKNPGKEILRSGFLFLERNYDSKWGGFGPAPKFPSPHNLMFLLRRHARDGDRSALGMVEKTLRAMRSGGIFDQFGFGFHRYSVDEQWLVPHFEKMLYDQAMISLACAEAGQVTGKDFYRQVAAEIAEYVIRDMTSPEGAFYSAEDADSEGGEGRFYTWEPGEVKACLGREKGALFCEYFNITETGNFEDGRSIPHLAESLESFASREGVDPEALDKSFSESRQKLLELRGKRPRPLRDDKIISGWNGLMIAALASGYQVFRDPGLLEAAAGCAEFILGRMRGKDGRLYRSCRGGELGIPAFLEDYAFLVWGLIELYEAAFDTRYLKEAVSLSESMIDLFADPGRGGFFFTGKDSEELISRARDGHDGAIPSGNSAAVMNLLRLAGMTGRADLGKAAEEAIKAYYPQAELNPAGSTHFLSGCDFYLGPSSEIIVSGDPEDPVAIRMCQAIQQAYLPNKVLMFRGAGGTSRDLDEVSEFTGTMGEVPDQPKVFWCEGFACREPITTLDKLREVIASTR